MNVALDEGLVLSIASEISMRLDICFSQLLGFAVSMIKATCTFAALGTANSMSALSYALALSSMLIPVESFLSTQVLNALLSMCYRITRYCTGCSVGRRDGHDRGFALRHALAEHSAGK